jgi:hypothetical protein
VKEDVRSAARYRQRAEDLRAMADGRKEETDFRKTLLDIAADYERMAESQERIGLIDHHRLKRRNMH